MRYIQKSHIVKICTATYIKTVKTSSLHILQTGSYFVVMGVLASEGNKRRNMSSVRSW